VWHASVAALDLVRRRTLQVAELSDATKRVLVRTAKRLISDVGQLPSAVEQMGGVAIHYRRALTDAEHAQLSPLWCDIPAIHEAGRGIVLETNT
jgi:hypothetical protein